MNLSETRTPIPATAETQNLSTATLAEATPRPFSKSLTPEAVKVVQEFGWDFFKAGVLIADEWPDKDQEVTYLLVREAKVKELQPDGSKKWVLSDKGKWNLPCGRLQPGESFEIAALREGYEETGFKLKLKQLCHIGHRYDNDNPYVIFIYAAEVAQFIAHPDPEEIAETSAFTYDKIVELRDAGQLRNPDLVMSALDQYRRHEKIPEHLVVTYPPKN